MVNFTLPSTTSEMISISTSQTFRSWVVIFHHRRHMACLSLNLYDTPGLAPRMNVLFWGPGDFPVSYSNRDTLWNAWNRHSGSIIVGHGIVYSNKKYPSHECSMPFWPLTSYNVFPTDQTLCQFHDLDIELDLHWITSGFHVAFATDVAWQHGKLTLPETWFLPHFWDLPVPIIESNFPELAVSFLDFSYWIPLDTFSILLRSVCARLYCDKIISVIIKCIQIMENFKSYWLLSFSLVNLCILRVKGVFILFTLSWLMSKTIEYN